MTEKRPRTSAMSKTDLMLLEKQLAFRTVKDSQRPSTGSFSVRSPSKNSFSQGSRDNNNSFSLPNINSSPSPSSSSQSPQLFTTTIDQELINTLSTKPISLRRKVQAKLKKKNPAFDSQPDLLSLKPDASYMKKGNEEWKNERMNDIPTGTSWLCTHVLFYYVQYPIHTTHQHNTSTLSNPPTLSTRPIHTPFPSTLSYRGKDRPYQTRHDV